MVVCLAGSYYMPLGGVILLEFIVLCLHGGVEGCFLAHDTLTVLAVTVENCLLPQLREVLRLVILGSLTDVGLSCLALGWLNTRYWWCYLIICR